MSFELGWIRVVTINGICTKGDYMGKNKKNTSVDILQLSSSDICNDVNMIDFKNKYKFKGSLSDSLMLRKVRSITKKKDFYIIDKHEYTKIIIDIDFSEDAYKKLETTHKIKVKSGKNKGEEIDIADKVKVATAESTRRNAYVSGVKLTDINTGEIFEYVNFQRGSNKSKTGHNLFILKQYYETMIKWCRIGLVFNASEDVDIASLRAYEALTSSAIENTIVINPNNILLIDDIKGYCEELQSVTTVKEIKIKDKKSVYEEVVEEKIMPIENDIWDGQSIGSSKLFEQKAINGNQQGSYLLRNHMLKSAMFNGEIQQYYQDNDVITVYNKFGDPMAAKDVMLITTPNSCKFFKFSDKIVETVLGKEKSLLLSTLEKEKITWDYWKNNIDSVFGICQTEHESKHVDNNWSKMTYQFKNTMPFDLNDLEILSKPCTDYSNLLAVNVSEFKKYIGADKTNISKNMMYNLLSVNNKVQYTTMYSDYRRRVRNDYRKELLKGRTLAEGDYAVITSCPYEMIRASAGETITKESLLHHRIDLTDKDNKPVNQYIYPIYCPGYDDGTELTMFRSPHIASGNVTVVKNIYKKELITYFPNFNKNIVVIDAFDCGIFDRLQGCDVDFDKAVIFSSPIILKRAKECLAFPTPVNKIEAEKKPRKLTGQQMAIVDNIIAKNKIGSIVNQSMTYNSYYWYYKSKNIDGVYDARLKELYKAISCLSSLSQSEIDKSKKMFAFKTSVILKSLSKKQLIDSEDMYIAYAYNYNQTPDEKQEVKLLKEQLANFEKGSDEYINIQKQIKGITNIEVLKPKIPMFFRNIFKVQKDAEYFDMDCPMNNLTHVINKALNKATGIKNPLSIKDILSDLPLKKANFPQISQFSKLAINYKKEVANIYVNLDKKSTKEEKKEIALQVSDLKSKVIEDMSNKKVTAITIAKILYSKYVNNEYTYLDSNGKEKDYGFILLTFLHDIYPDIFLEAIKQSSGKVSMLIECKHGNIEKFGKMYTEIEFDLEIGKK